MADTYTPNFNLVLPEVGASRNTWGSKVNTNMQSLDSYVAARMPPGATIDFAGSTVPNGWALCDGRALNRTTYAKLFAAIGTTWGAGDGSTTFNIPDLRGRIAVAAGSSTDDGGAATGCAAVAFDEPLSSAGAASDSSSSRSTMFSKRARSTK